MLQKLTCEGVPVGIRFISDNLTADKKAVKTFEIKQPYFERLHFNDDNFVKQFLKAKNNMLYHDAPKHDTTGNFKKLLKRYSHGKSFLTVSEFAELVKAIGYKGFYYAYGLISCFEDVKICKKSIRITDSTGLKQYISYTSNYKLYIDNFALIHNNK